MNPSSFQSETPSGPERLLQVFHDETRGPIRLGTPQRPIELDGLIRREYEVDGGHWNMIESPDGLGPDPEEWDAVIVRQRDFFAGLGLRVEWKTYDYDEPADLGERLVRAGFVKEEDEALVLGEAAPLAAQDLALPDGVVVRAADCDEDFARMARMLEVVWDESQAWVVDSLLPRWGSDPSSMDVVVVEESREGPVLCGARAEYDDSGFTGLWGGSTLPEWRGRGLYRATLLHRARLGLGQGPRARRRLARLRADPAPPRPAPRRDDDPVRLRPRHLSLWDTPGVTWGTWGTRETVVTRASRSPRASLPRTVLAAVAVAASVLGACTSEGVDPVAGGATAPATAVMRSDPSATRPDPSANRPDPGMTPIEAAPQCTTTRPLTGKGRVPLDAVFPGAETSAFSAPREVVPGPDAADRARCPGELPSDPHCDGLVPWTDLPADAFVPASRARRLVEGYLLTMPKQAGNQAPPESSAGTKVVTYSLVDLAAGDPGGLVDHLHVAFTACAKAMPSRVAGVDALVGTVRSEYGAGAAEVVLLRRGTHLVWAALDGSGWQQGEQERALAVLVARLL